MNNLCLELVTKSGLIFIKDVHSNAMQSNCNLVLLFIILVRVSLAFNQTDLRFRHLCSCVSSQEHVEIDPFVVPYLPNTTHQTTSRES